MNEISTDYWTIFCHTIGAYPTGLTQPSRVLGYYVRFPRTGFGFQRSALFNQKRQTIAVELICEVKIVGEAYRRAELIRSKISDETKCLYPGELVWNGTQDNKYCKAWEEIPARVDDRTDWSAQHTWLASRLILLEIVFGPIVRGLEAA